jgi:hypothetical protein
LMPTDRRWRPDVPTAPVWALICELIYLAFRGYTLCWRHAEAVLPLATITVAARRTSTGTRSYSPPVQRYSIPILRPST